MADLKGRSVRGGAVTLSAQGVKFVLQLCSTAVLARLLTPADFGLIAMVAAFTGFVVLFNDLGLSMATVQRAEITHEQVSTLFWINVALSVVLIALAAGLAPMVAWFYGDPRLTWIVLAVAGTFIFGGLTAQHYALLVRQMRFKAVWSIQLGSLAAGIAVGIGLAVLGAGYWALVVMGAVQAATTTVLTWTLSGWWPGLPRRNVGLRRMLWFGGSLTGSNVLNYMTRNSDNLLIGWWWGASTLGIYSKAYALLMMPFQQLNAPLNGVVLPALSRLQNDPGRYQRFYLRALRYVALAGMPIIVFAAIETEAIVLTVLGTQWFEAIPLFRFLAPAALFGTLQIAPAWAFTSLDRPELLLRWSMVSTVVVIGGFLVAIPHGALAVAASFSITFSCLFVLMMMHVAKVTSIRPRDLVASLAMPAGAAAGAAVVLFVSRLLWPDVAVQLHLGLQAVVYVISCLTIWMLIPGGRHTLFELMSLIRSSEPKGRAEGDPLAVLTGSEQ